jgi:DNA-binding transcriptional MerR regulator
MTEGYRIGQLAELAGVSTRTLRYYDEIGLLCPSGYSPAGYRIYRQGEVDLLQHILFYRELDIELDDIRRMIQDPAYRKIDALERHRSRLLKRIARLDRILRTLERTIQSEEQGVPMSDKDKFSGFADALIADNEKRHGSEARQRWGDAEVDQANDRLRGKSKEDFARFEALSAEVLERLKAAMADGDPAGAEGRRCAELHRQFLEFWWDEYRPEAHWALVEMYLQDERFTAYYDKPAGKGATVFLKRCVADYLKNVLDFTP